MDNYICKYINFKSSGKTESTYLNSANSLIGDEVKIKQLPNMLVEIDNKFSQNIGALNKQDSHDIILSINKGLKCRAYLSFVAYNHTSHPYHWGEILFIAYPKNSEDIMDKFCANIGKTLSQGVRPDVHFDKFSLQKIEDNNGDWLPKKSKGSPKMDEGNAVVKKKKSLLDKSIEQGRNKNPGCYAASIIFIATIIVGIILIFLSLFGLI